MVEKGRGKGAEREEKGMREKGREDWIGGWEGRAEPQMEVCDLGFPEAVC